MAEKEPSTEDLDAMSDEFQAINLKDASSSSDVIREKVGSVVCDGCSMVGKVASAFGFCPTCSDNLCRTCIHLHSRVKLTRDHVIQSLRGASSVRDSLETRITLTDMCRKTGHEHKLLEYLCHDCDEVICSVCSNTDHHGCSKILYILDIADDIGKRLNIADDFGAKISTLSNSLKESADKIKRNQDLVEKYFDGPLFEVKRNKRAIEKWLNDLCSKEEADIKQTKRACRNSIDDANKKCQSLLTELGALRADVAVYDAADEAVQRYIRMMKHRQVLKALESNARQMEAVSELTQYNFILNANLRKLRTEVTELGRLEIVHPVNATKIAEINIRTGSDQFPCNITGLTVANANSLIVLDRSRQTSGNNVIKHYHAVKGHLISKVNTLTQPFDVTTVADDKLAVTFPNDGEVKFVRITRSGKLKIDGSLSLGQYCRGVCHAEGKLFVTYDSPQRKLMIFDLHGILHKEICYAADGENIFSNPFYVAYNPERQVIHVSDFDKRQIVNLTLDGEVLSAENISSFGSPSGMTVGLEGRVFACVALPPSVCEVMHHKVCPLAGKDEGLIYPQAITYHEKTKCLYVGMWGKDCLQVYSLKKPK